MVARLATTCLSLACVGFEGGSASDKQPVSGPHACWCTTPPAVRRGQVTGGFVGRPTMTDGAAAGPGQGPALLLLVFPVFLCPAAQVGHW